ncbi:MAG TPA: hypothetical protein VLG09_00660 [Candidatus Saccharimonadales bacterium]|nr:hypothetical protein [Candidatus Saccharimonadales bacterium]
MRYVQHWQLIVDEEFIADTSIPRMGDKFIEIAEAINEVAST